MDGEILGEIDGDIEAEGDLLALAEGETEGEIDGLTEGLIEGEIDALGEILAEPICFSLKAAATTPQSSLAACHSTVTAPAIP